MNKFIVLDTETTGIEVSEGHRLIEIGAVEILNRTITGGQYHQYLQPERQVGDSVRIHGLTDAFLANKSLFKDNAHEFLAYIEGATLIIHNAPFDLGFLNHELKRCKINTRIENICPIIDTLALSKQQSPGMMHNLDALCRRFDVDTSSRIIHGALLDAKVLANVYLAMTGGQAALFDATSTDTKQTHTSAVIRMNSNRQKIKVQRATQTELDAHTRYFERDNL